jgi:hypothetical protein
VFGKKVAVEWNERDHYQRVLGKVLLDGQDINLKQIKAGLAWHYKQYDKGQRLADQSLYASAEESARRKGVGLWRDPAPVAPWDFRREKRAASVVDEECEIVLPGFRYKIEPVICEIYRDVLTFVSTLSKLMELTLATRRGSSDAN